jgi:hypothetical protein
MGYKFNVFTGTFDVDNNSGGGGSSNSFETIQVPAGTSPVASGPADVLTLADGVGISISGDAGTDTVTIAITSGTPNAVAGFDSSGDFASFDNWIKNSNEGLEITQSLTPSDIGTTTFVLNRLATSINPTEALTDYYFQQADYLTIGGTFNVNDVTVQEYSLALNDSASANDLRLVNRYLNLNGSGNANNIIVQNTGITLGNGTDTTSNNDNYYDNLNFQIRDNHTTDNSFLYNVAINLDPSAVANDIQIFNAYGNINGTANGLQAFGFNPTIQTGSDIGYVTWGYSNPQIDATIDNFTGFGINGYGTSAPTNFQGAYINPNFSGTIATFSGVSLGSGSNSNITNYQGFVINADTIGDFYTGVNVGGTVVSEFNYLGVNVAPTVSGNLTYAAGINVTMDNVTVFPGVASSLVVQDLTYTCDQVGIDGDNISIEYTSGGTAGSEVVNVSGFAISVQIDSGVSTATQIKTAIEASLSAAVLVNVTISGVGSNPQVTAVATNLAGGAYAGQKYAAFFDGDVSIDGALTFNGALSVGKLSAFASQALVDGGGTPGSVHGLITQPTVAANVTVTNADLLGVNTAALINIGDNAVVTTAFLGVAALGLPAVLSMGSGATVDNVAGAVFAISLDASATGGTVDNVYLCRALALPNGVTTINKLYGYAMNLPFGDPGTVTWGFYESPGAHNYFQGDLLIGGTAGSDDVVTNSSIALEIKSTTKAFMNARMTTTERNALTAVNGMQIYNSTTDKLQVYAGGTWVDLH